MSNFSIKNETEREGKNSVEIGAGQLQRGGDGGVRAGRKCGGAPVFNPTRPLARHRTLSDQPILYSLVKPATQ